jgi:ring-1,2-phenylacetyl-CoA epoxidase subunit PaaC
MTNQEAIFEYCLRIGDTSLILGQRLAEWCGHGPILEEDIALTNISLDLIGQTRGFYDYACQVENKGRTEDDLAFLRNDRDYRNLLMAEQPNGDFGQTIFRQFLISSYYTLFFTALSKSNDETLAALAQKSLKEVNYHLRHSTEWMLRLGNGTEESARRMRTAVEELWMFTEDFFDMNDVDRILLQAGIGIDNSALRADWLHFAQDKMKEAGLLIPEKSFAIRGSREGKHTEHLGHILAEMQSLHRAHPGATW